MSLILAAAFCGLSFLPPLPPQRSETSYRYRVPLGSRRGRTLALLRNYDLLGSCSGTPFLPGSGTIDVVLAPGERPAFLRLFPDARLVDRGRPFADIAAERRARDPQGPDANYFTVAEIEAELLRLQKAHPTLALRVDLNALTKTSKTWNGHSLYALKISDRVGADEGEPAILIASQHHARELNGPYMTIQAARRILAGYATDPLIKAAVDAYEIWIVPCVNPDGVDWVWTKDNYWRKNRRNNGRDFGVDLNRNYPFAWGRCGSSSWTRSQVYRGPSAASEPEVRTMIALAKAKRFERYLDFHSYGQEVLSTYSPCIATSYARSPVLGYHAGLRNVLASSMRYRVRSPSASGEAPEWHWAENGTLSFLVEVGRSFQPVFTTTKAEELRVWPGIRKWLAWVPPLRGRLESLKGRLPVAGALLLKDFGFLFGERTRARADGKFALWGPAGMRGLVLSGPGHDSRTLTETLPATGTRTVRYPLLPTLPAAVLQAPATHKMGTPTSILLKSGQAFRDYWIAMSAGTRPGIPLPLRTLPLNPDGLFQVSAFDLRPIYSGHLGKTDAKGNTTARFAFPRSAFFHGFTIHFAGMLLDPSWPLGVQAFTPPIALRLVF